MAAALCIAIGDVVQQRTARAVTDADTGRLALFAALLRDRRWWAGSLAAVLGTVLQAAALGVGSVLLVQVLLVTSLLFALPMNARLDHQRVTRSIWLWAGLLVAAEAVIVGVGHPSAGQSHITLRNWILVAAVAGPVLVGCLVGARRWPGRVAAVLLAVVSGMSWGVFAVLTKGVVDLLSRGPAALLSAPELYAWAGVGLIGAVAQQSAFQAGALTASLPTMTVAEPVVAAALSVTLLGEVLRPGRAGWFALVAAVAVMVAATVVLSRSEAGTGPDRATAAPRG